MYTVSLETSSSSFGCFLCWRDWIAFIRRCSFPWRLLLELVPILPLLVSILLLMSPRWLPVHGLRLVVLSIGAIWVGFLLKIRIFLLTRGLLLRSVASLLVMPTSTLLARTVLTLGWSIASISFFMAWLASSSSWVVHLLILIKLGAWRSVWCLILMRLVVMTLLSMASIFSSRLTYLIRILVVFLRLHRPAVSFLVLNIVDVEVLSLFGS